MLLGEKEELFLEYIREYLMYYGVPGFLSPRGRKRPKRLSYSPFNSKIYVQRHYFQLNPPPPRD
jgi:hypothetical protein